ncbi:uncharacterized protein LOC141993021 [Natator depressus]|uniref:uncharacterized protein LOC141993021 n=1 Tax=Natator depressus TaxID=27790 RepID=UPI003EB772F7
MWISPVPRRSLASKEMRASHIKEDKPHKDVVKVRRGADVGSDHHFVTASINLKLRSVGPPNKRHRLYDIDKLKSPEIQKAFVLQLKNMFQALADLDEQEGNANEEINKKWGKQRYSQPSFFAVAAFLTRFHLVDTITPNGTASFPSHHPRHRQQHIQRAAKPQGAAPSRFTAAHAGDWSVVRCCLHFAGTPPHTPLQGEQQHSSCPFLKGSRHILTLQSGVTVHQSPLPGDNQLEWLFLRCSHCRRGDACGGSRQARQPVPPLLAKPPGAAAAGQRQTLGRRFRGSSKTTSVGNNRVRRRSSPGWRAAGPGRSGQSSRRWLEGAEPRAGSPAQEVHGRQRQQPPARAESTGEAPVLSSCRRRQPLPPPQDPRQSSSGCRGSNGQAAPASSRAFSARLRWEKSVCTRASPSSIPLSSAQPGSCTPATAHPIPCLLPPPQPCCVLPAPLLAAVSSPYAASLPKKK